MKARILLCLACFPILMSCWKPPLMDSLDGYEPPVLPELVKARAIYFANRYGISNTCLIEKVRVVYEPFIFTSVMPDSASWRKRMNKDANIFCDSVLRDHRDLLPALQVRFNVFFFTASGTDELGAISFEYNDLTKYPFNN